MIGIGNLTPQYITNEAGAKRSVALPISRFIEILENLEKLGTIAKRRSEPAIAHEDVLKELKEDHLI